MPKSRKTLCGRCVAQLRGGGFLLTQVGGKTDKATCEHCGKRRYATDYEVEASASKKKGGKA